MDDDDDEHYWRDPFIDLSAEDIVREGLRLYPPSRRLYRAFDWGPLRDEEHSMDESNDDLSASNGSRPEIRDMDEAVRSPHCRILATDLESCLLNVDNWGSQAHRFNPARWCKLTKDQKNSMAFGTGLMTFGIRPNRCPAEEEYGARMIGVLVGALLVGLQGKDDWSKMTWKLGCRDPKVMAELEAKRKLRLERDAYNDLVLVGTR